MSSEKLNFENLKAYQKAVDFYSKTYNLTKSWPKEYLYDLSPQIRREALSIPLNLAEGSGRTKKEYRRFIDISRASCFELIPLIEIAQKQSLITAKTEVKTTQRIEELSRMLSGLKASLK